MRLPQSNTFIISLLLVVVLAIGLLPTSPVEAQKSRWHITRHFGEGGIRNAQWTPDGSHILLQTGASVYIYTSTLKFIGKLPESSTDFSLDRDGKYAAYITDDGHTVAFWNLQKNRVERSFTHQDDIKFWDTAFSPDGKSIALLTDKETLTVWDLETEHVLHTIEAKNAFSLSWSPDSSRIAACGYSNTWECSLIDPTVEKVLITVEVSSGYNFVWKPDGKQFGVSADQYTINIYDAQTGELAKALRLNKDTSSIFSWSPDGTRIANRGVVWDATTYQQVWSRPGLGTAIWTPDSKYVLYSELDSDYKHNLSSAFLARFDATNGSTMSKNLLDKKTFDDWDEWSIFLNPDGSRMLIVGENQGNLRLYNPSPLQLLTSTQIKEAAPNAWLGTFSPDATMIATRQDILHDIVIWNAATGEIIRTLPAHQAGVNTYLSLAWSPDGQFLIDPQIYFPHDNPSVSIPNVWLWSVKPGIRRLLPSRIDNSAPENIGKVISPVNASWRPDGKALAISDKDGMVRLVEFPSYKLLWVVRAYLDKENFRAVEWSPDGKQFMVSQMDRIATFDGMTGQKLVEMEHVQGDHEPEWAMDGKRIFAVASGGEGAPNGNLEVWDASSGKKLDFPIKNCYPFAINPDGKSIVCNTTTSDKRGSTLIVDINTGEILSEPLPMSSYVMEWSRDGKRLLVAWNIAYVIEQE